jgi:hypothetical protein
MLATFLIMKRILGLYCKVGQREIIPDCHHGGQARPLVRRRRRRVAIQVRKQAARPALRGEGRHAYKKRIIRSIV